MKQLILILLLFSLLSISSRSQAPQAIKYQAIIRNSSGQIIQNQKVSVRTSILQGSVSGSTVYTEVQTDSVNSSGLINLQIGMGSPVSGLFNAIDWSAGPYFLETEVDPAGGSNYSLLGTSQLLSVPYALFAGKSAGADSKFEVNAHNQTSSDSALFVVRDRNGNAVFTVYENGVDVTYDESVKGAKGGFTVGGRTTAKGTVQNILTVNSDSVRVYIDTTETKGAKGGFVVGGRSLTKGDGIQYLKIGGNNTTDTTITRSFSILNNGNVGINKAAPTKALDIGTGWATVAPGFDWLTPSDLRYKTNIVSFGNVLDKVLQLRAVRYNLKTEVSHPNSNARHIGFIAQELELQFPEFVITNEKGYKAVAYDKLTTVLVEAIKEQQIEIENLKAENEKLKVSLQKISGIEERLRLLEEQAANK